MCSRSILLTTLAWWKIYIYRHICHSLSCLSSECIIQVSILFWRDCLCPWPYLSPLPKVAVVYFFQAGLLFPHIQNTKCSIASSTLSQMLKTPRLPSQQKIRQPKHQLSPILIYAVWPLGNMYATMWHIHFNHISTTNGGWTRTFMALLWLQNCSHTASNVSRKH